MSERLRGRVGLLLVAVLAIGGYTLGPAVAGSFLTKKAAKKKFVRKKAAKARYLAKAQAEGTYAKLGGSYTKAEADGRFAPLSSGPSYTKAEADGRFAPLSSGPQGITVMVPPSAWSPSAENGDSTLNIPGSTEVSYQNKTMGALNNLNFFANAATNLPGPAEVSSARFCFRLGSNASLDFVNLERSKPLAAPTVISGAGTSAPAGVSQCKVLSVPAGTMIDPDDVLGFTVQTDLLAQGSTGSIAIGSVTIELEVG